MNIYFIIIILMTMVPVSAAQDEIGESALFQLEPAPQVAMPDLTEFYERSVQPYKSKRVKIRTPSQKIKTPSPCDRCPFIAKCRDNLNMHRLIHIAQVGDYKCLDCGATFTHPSVLTRHRYLHTPARDAKH